MLWPQFHDWCAPKRSCLLWSSDAFWNFRLSSFMKIVLGAFSRFMCPKTKLLAVNSDAFWKFSPCKLCKKSCGCIFPIYVSIIKLFAVKFRRILEGFASQASWKKFSAQFPELCIQKWSCFLWSSDSFWKFSPYKLYKKSSGRIFPVCASKNEAVCREVQMHSGTSLPASFTEKVVGVNPRFMRPKTKLFAVKFRRILEVLCLWVLQKKLWAQFHDLCVQKGSCFPWNSDALWKFSFCEVYRKSCWRNSTICASRNEAVWCEIQTDFGSSCFAMFVKRVKLRYHDLCTQKWNCLLWRSNAFQKFSTSKVYR